MTFKIFSKFFGQVMQIGNYFFDTMMLEQGENVLHYRHIGYRYERFRDLSC